MHGFENLNDQQHEVRQTITVPHLNNSNKHLYYPTLGLAFFQSVLTLGSRIDFIDANQYYHRMSTEILSGDTIFTFGKVRFNEAHGFFIDKPIAYVSASVLLGDALKPLCNHLSFDRWKQAGLACVALVALAGCGILTGYFG